jgi:hypothetical protein
MKSHINTQSVNTNIEYYKWVNSAEQLTYVGVLTMESDTHFSLLTKCGELTFPKGDGEVIEATREEFEVNQPVTEKQFPVKRLKLHAITNKDIVHELIKTNPDLSKKEVVELIMVKLNVTKSNASVYYYNATKTDNK